MENSIYAPPSASEQYSNVSENGFSDNGLLVIRNGFVSPPVCLLSGKQNELHPKTFVKWIVYTPKVPLFLWICSIIFCVLLDASVPLVVNFSGIVFWLGVIILAFLQRKVKIRFYLSAEKAKQYKRNRAITCVILLMAIALIATAVVTQIYWLSVISGILFLIAILVSMFTKKIVKLVRYHAKYFYLTGVAEQYLTHLPSVYENQPIGEQIAKV